jgi:hypothetical protein
MNLNTTELIDTLKKNKVLIEFVKIDGSQRRMLCTQNSSIIDGKKTPVGKKETTKGVITVFDLEKNDWRSMRESSITNWTIET